MLFEYGHAAPGSYTPRQAQLYLDAIGRREKRLRRERLIDLRAARAGDDSFEKYLRMFDR